MRRNCLKSVILMLMVVGVLAGSVLLSTASAHTTYDSVYNVKNYGAVGSGNVDDAEEITNAISAAMIDGGGTVYFPAGTYKIGSECNDPWFTFFSPVMAEFANGAKLKPVGKMLNFCGGICAGRHQIFDGDRNVWIIENQSELYPEWWGANGHDEVSDYSAFQCMMDNLSNGNDRTYKISLDSSGRYIIDDDLTLPAGWTLQGHAGTTDTSNLSDMGSTILLKDDAALYLEGSSTVSGVNFLKQEISSWPQETLNGYTGTALIVDGPDVTVEGGTIVGFDDGILNYGWNRASVRDLAIDCDRYCVCIDGPAKNCRFENIECGLYGTYEESGPGPFGPFNRPNGFAYYFVNGASNISVDNCFAFGWFRDFWVEDCSNVRFMSAVADYLYTIDDGGIGFVLINSTGVELHGCMTYSQSIGYHMLNSRCRLVGCQAYTMDGHGVLVDNTTCSPSRVIVSSSDFRTVVNAVTVVNASSYVLIHGNMVANDSNILFNYGGSPNVTTVDNVNW